MLRNCVLGFYTPISEEEVTVFKLSQPIGTYPKASNSVIFATAAFLVWKFPELHHPQFLEDSLEDVVKNEEFPSNMMEVYHPLFECWTKSLYEAVFEGNAIREGDTLFVILKTDKEYEKYLKKQTYQWIQETYSKSASLQQIFKLTSKHSEKRVGYINVSGSQLKSDRFQPKVNVIGILLGSIYNNQKWTHYQILKSSVPTSQELMAFDTLIIPGSTNSILDDIESIKKFTVEMRKAYEQSKVKILGLCYGHQLIGMQFKGTIQRKQRYGGMQNVQFDKSVIQKFPFLQRLPVEKSMLLEHHEDFVETVPEEFYLLGKSKSCSVEALVSKNGRILSYQFHCEYLRQYPWGYFRRLKAHNKLDPLDLKQIKISEEDTKLHIESSEKARICIMDFINS